MVKVLYQGDISPCRITILSTRIDNLKKGDILDLGEREASKVVGDNKNFSYIGNEEKVKKGQKEARISEEQIDKEKKIVDFDLDGDGDVDSDDYSIAAKTLAHARKTKKNDNIKGGE